MLYIQRQPRQGPCPWIHSGCMNFIVASDRNAIKITCGGDYLVGNRAATWKPKGWIQTVFLNNLELEIKFNPESLFFPYSNSLSSSIYLNLKFTGRRLTGLTWFRCLVKKDRVSGSWHKNKSSPCTYMDGGSHRIQDGDGRYFRKSERRQLFRKSILGRQLTCLL